MQINIPFEPLDCLYVAVPKAACTAVKTALWEAAWGSPPGKAESDIHPACDALAVSDERAAACRWPLRFTVVRHPLPRLFSLWWSRAHNARLHLDGIGTFERGASLYTILERMIQMPPTKADPHVRPQHLLLRHEGTLKVDFIGRLERLNEDWRRVCGALGLDPPSELPMLNNSGSRWQWWQLMTTKEIDLAACYYAEDLRLFGYDISRG